MAASMRSHHPIANFFFLFCFFHLHVRRRKEKERKEGVLTMTPARPTPMIREAPDMLDEETGEGGRLCACGVCVCVVERG